MTAARVRLDAELVRRGLARSREQAGELVAAGRVTVAGQRAAKVATQVRRDAPISVADTGEPGYVSRGGHKLAGALAVFGPAGLAVAGRACLVVGGICLVTSTLTATRAKAGGLDAIATALRVNQLFASEIAAKQPGAGDSVASTDPTVALKAAHDLGVVEQLLADALDGLAHRFDVRGGLEVKVELHHRPVAAKIGDRLDLPERDRVHLTVLVAQPHRAQRHSLDGAAQPAGVDILADPKRVLHQKEDARDHIAHQALRAKADRDADDTEPGEERADVKTERRESDDHRDDRKPDQQGVA